MYSQAIKNGKPKKKQWNNIYIQRVLIILSYVMEHK